MNANVAAYVERIPSVKKLAAAMENPKVVQTLSKNPGLVMKLAKDTQVVKAAAVVEKSNVKVTKDTVNALRVAAANDPVKLSKLNIVDKILGLGSMAAFTVIALGALSAIGMSITALFV
ncbi:unnamed protein product [Phytophthora fragariaefolia]|uniref:Unnamed protein product n=1 Tax=Phytophthora fragariaefolia TaxID=1490495 RepID=A0A9W6X5L5_9STRA|nr:unnamed protein product [Phytophthora fragariaefolia]